MAASNNQLERMGIGLVLCVALLMFFAPLVTVNGPTGNESGNGYNIRTRLIFLQSGINTIISSASEDARASVVNATETASAPKPPDAPFSLGMNWLTQWLIFASLACAALALLNLFLFQKATRILGLAGGSFGALAIFHVSMMGSDLRSWTVDLVNSGALGSLDNPLLAARMLLVDSFQLGPGPGLFALTSCMFFVAFLSYTSAIPRVSRVMRHQQRTKLSQPIRVRPANANYSEEDSTTVDVSPNGLYFESSASHYYAGMEVFVSRNVCSDVQNPREEHGSVVRVQNLPSGKFGVAIHIFSVS